MKKEIKNKPASIKAKLLSISRSERIDFDNLLLRYLQERFLYRCSISKFSKYLVLKGGLLLICLDIPMTRPTIDIDFLGENIKNNPEDIKEMIKEIAGLDFNDGTKFLVSSIKSERIKEDTDYEGLRIKIDAVLGKAKKKMQIDIGFGDKIIPKAEIMQFPTLLKEEAPVVRVYSVESIISEKFEAMVKLAMVNSRMKDFYDVYNLSLNHEFTAGILKEAITATFKRRKTILPENPLVFQTDFRIDRGRQQQWVAFLNKSRLFNVDKSFSKIMDRIVMFLKPIVSSIKNNTAIADRWNITAGIWE